MCVITFHCLKTQEKGGYNFLVCSIIIGEDIGRLKDIPHLYSAECSGNMVVVLHVQLSRTGRRYGLLEEKCWWSRQIQRTG